MNLVPPKSAFIIGWGSQGSAWAECLRAQGSSVEIFLSQKGSSFERAWAAGFVPRLLSELPDLARQADVSPLPVAMLCPDDQIAPVYGDYIARVERPLVAVLAHGYAIYARELKAARSDHEFALLAPKAIGPKLMAAGLEAQRLRASHSLKAGVFAPSLGARRVVEGLAHALGFAKEGLIDAGFEQEAVGDLISEQGLLCGGVFTLMEWTMEAMARAGVPDALIREECLTELELVAGLLRDLGPATTFGKISQAAQCGTIAMRERWIETGAREAFEKQAQDVVSGAFVQTMRDPSWKSKADEFRKKLRKWEERLAPPHQSRGKAEGTP